MLAVASFASPAGATVLVGHADGGQTDNSGIPTNQPLPTILSFDAEYDDGTGRFTGTTTLSEGDPALRSGSISMVLGTRTAAGCYSPIVRLWGYVSLPLSHSSAMSADYDSGYVYSGTSSFDGNRVTFSGSSPSIVGRRFDCLIAYVRDNLDRIRGSSAIGILAGPDAPPSPPAPQPPVVVPPPVAAPPKVVLVPKLNVGITGLSDRKRSGQQTVAVRVSNGGTGPADGVTLRIRPGRGVSATPASYRLGRLAAGRAKTLRVRLRPGRRARSTTRVALVVSGTGGLKATAILKLRTR